jgi:hypothetical protein
MMADHKNVHYDPEGEKIVHQQITESYQSGVIDRILENEKLIAEKEESTSQ